MNTHAEIPSDDVQSSRKILAVWLRVHRAQVTIWVVSVACAVAVVAWVSSLMAARSVSWEPVNYWFTDMWPFIRSWVGTAGFGGAVALLAAATTVNVTVRKHRHETWWEQTEWALGRYMDPEAKPYERQAGLNAIAVLLESRLARAAEVEFLSAVATAVTIDAVGDGDETDDLAEDLSFSDESPLDNSTAPDDTEGNSTGRR